MSRILIIDDDEQIRQLFGLILERAGHQVLGASDGVQAMRLCQAQTPDLVFCDIFMPRMDGLETMKEIRLQCPKAKIVAISGGAQTIPMDFLPIAAMTVADMVLQKPVSREALLAAVESLACKPCLDS